MSLSCSFFKIKYGHACNVPVPAPAASVNAIVLPTSLIATILSLSFPWGARKQTEFFFPETALQIFEDSAAGSPGGIAGPR